MTDTPTPQITPEQRAELVGWLRKPYDCTHGEDATDMSAAADQLEADSITIATLTAERDAAQAELSSKEDIIARLTAALATPDQIAALAADRAATVTVKPLVWVQSHLASWNDDWHTVPTAYSIRYADENGWKWSTCGGFGYCHSAEAAKAAAQADYDARIRAAITITSGASPDTIPLPRAEVEALMEAAEAGLHRDNCPSVEFAGGQCDCGRDDVLAALATLQERMK